MANLIEGIQQQQERVRKIIPNYEAIGSSGIFGLAMLKGAIEHGDRAIASGNVVDMLSAYKELEGCAE